MTISDQPSWKSYGQISVLIGLAVGGLLATLWAFGKSVEGFQEAGAFRPEIILTVLLLAALTALIVSLAIVVAVFRALGLSSRTNSLGLPEGSVQAVIALSLILIFSIMAVFLYSNLRSEPFESLIGISRREAADIPKDLVLARRPNEKNARLVDVKVAVPASQESKDFAKQIGTTVSTLVVAVAGFYFGSRTAAGQRDRDTDHPRGRRLRLRRPRTSPTGLSLQPGSSLEIRLDVPRDETVEGEIVRGDDDGELRAIREPDRWRYTRGQRPEARVVLRFALTNEPDEAVQLIVRDEAT